MRCALKQPLTKVSCCQGVFFGLERRFPSEAAEAPIDGQKHLSSVPSSLLMLQLAKHLTVQEKTCTHPLTEKVVIQDSAEGSGWCSQNDAQLSYSSGRKKSFYSDRAAQYDDYSRLRRQTQELLHVSFAVRKTLKVVFQVVLGALIDSAWSFLLQQIDKIEKKSFLFVNAMISYFYYLGKEADDTVLLK